MITYQQFVTQYLNKVDPTGMYYTVDEIAKESNTPVPVVQGYLNFSQEVNLRYLMRTGRTCPDQVLIIIWDVIIALITQGKLPVPPQED